jgi:hypothetical protein
MYYLTWFVEESAIIIKKKKRLAIGKIQIDLSHMQYNKKSSLGD